MYFHFLYSLLPQVFSFDHLNVGSIFFKTQLFLMRKFFNWTTYFWRSMFVLTIIFLDFFFFSFNYHVCLFINIFFLQQPWMYLLLDVYETFFSLTCGPHIGRNWKFIINHIYTPNELNYQPIKHYLHKSYTRLWTYQNSYQKANIL